MTGRNRIVQVNADASDQRCNHHKAGQNHTSQQRNFDKTFKSIAHHFTFHVFPMEKRGKLNVVPRRFDESEGIGRFYEILCDFVANCLSHDKSDDEMADNS
jgi:hypothetical protein